MKEKGFTLLEILTVIAILSVVTGLAYQAHRETDKAVRVGNHIGDALGTTVRFMDRIQDVFRSIDIQSPVLLSEKHALFKTLDKNQKGSVEISENDSGIELIEVYGETRREFKFEGTFSLSFWDGAKWIPTWTEKRVPRAVSIVYTPAPIRGYRMEPFALAMNLNVAWKDQLTANDALKPESPGGIQP